MQLKKKKMEEQNFINVNDAINEIKKINCVDYGSMFDYEVHNAVREVLREIIDTLENMPTIKKKELL